MPERTPTPSDVDTIFDLGLKSGAATTAALASVYGWNAAVDDVDREVQATLTEDERGILAAAVHLILAQRHAAPDDLSTLPAVEMRGCSDASCDICRGATR
jgi:hypothetical protein